MSAINLKKGSKVFYKNEEHQIIQIINFNKVAIKDIQTNDIINVSLNELSSSSTAIKEKSYIEDYSEQEWTQAKKRYQIIENLIFTKRTKANVEKVAKENNYSSVTLYNWIKLYEQTQEISSLIPNTSQRGKKGGRLNTHVENIISLILDEYFLNKQRYSFKRIYNKIYKQCKENNLIPPHENTIRNRIDALDQKLVTKKRHGHKESNKQFENYEGEFPEGNYPLDFIQIDHTPLDIRVVDKIHRKPIGRPYLTLAIDVYSRMIAGIYVSLQAPGYYNVSQCLFNVFSQKENLLNKH